MKYEIEIYDEDVSLAGPDAPPVAKKIDDLIRYLATVRSRFGNTAVSFSLKWGGNALNDEARECMRLIRKFTEQKGTSVEIFSQNPESEPPQFVISTANEQFVGDSILACLTSAVESVS